MDRPPCQPGDEVRLRCGAYPPDKWLRVERVTEDEDDGRGGCRIQFGAALSHPASEVIEVRAAQRPAQTASEAQP